MFLKRLKEYADRHPPAVPSGYTPTRIKWFIDIDAEGRFLGFVPTTSMEAKEGKKDRGKEFMAPHLRKTSGVGAKLLAETGPYVIGIPKAKDKPERVVACRQAFVSQVRSCAETTGDAAVQSVLRFLEARPAELPLPAGFDPADVLTFRVEGFDDLPIHRPAVRAYWAAHSSQDEEAPELDCIVCGQRRPVVRRLPLALKGIPGGQTSGVALISANESAFESYGLEASLIAPICYPCAESTHQTLNEFLGNRYHSIRVGNVAYVAWTREPADPLLHMIADPQPDEVVQLIQGALAGAREATGRWIDPNAYFAAALTASGGRAVMRRWIETTVGQIRENLKRYFLAQQIIDTGGQIGRPLGVWVLARATVSAKAKNQEPHPRLVDDLLRVALGGGPLPPWVLVQAVRRCQAEQGVTRPQAALIKLSLCTRPEHDHREGELVMLEEHLQSPGYRCGRLLAVLEAIQEDALGKVNATLVDRYFGTASTAPAVVFPSLVKHAMPHLAKLRKEKPGLHTIRQRRLEAIMAGLGEFRPLLELEEQGLFALGYYHERAERWKSTKAQGTQESEPGSNPEEGMNDA